MRILAVAGMGAVHHISPENIVRSCDGFPPNFISFADEFGGRMLDFLQLRFLGKNSSDYPALTLLSECDSPNENLEFCANT
jgi:hypothetical protein